MYLDSVKLTIFKNFDFFTSNHINLNSEGLNSKYIFINDNDYSNLYDKSNDMIIKQKLKKE